MKLVVILLTGLLLVAVATIFILTYGPQILRVSIKPDENHREQIKTNISSPDRAQDTRILSAKQLHDQRRRAAQSAGVMANQTARTSLPKDASGIYPVTAPAVGENGKSDVEDSVGTTSDIPGAATARSVGEQAARQARDSADSLSSGIAVPGGGGFAAEDIREGVVANPAGNTQVGGAAPLPEGQQALTEIFNAMTTYSEEGAVRAVQFLGSTDSQVRNAAVEALKQIKSPASAEPLRRAADRASSQEEKERLLQAAEFVELPIYVPNWKRESQ